MNPVLQKMSALGLIPVVKIDDPANAVSLGAALIEGGLPIAEITFRTIGASTAISLIARRFPDMLVGAGTVLSTSQAEEAVAAGAQFIVSPGLSISVVDWCQARDVPVIPGVATPTEIMQGLDKGLTILKFFPAETLGGVAALKAMGAAFGGIRFIPTGGISAANLPDYLRLKSVHAVGGSWMVMSDLIASGQFERISTLAREASDLVVTIRGTGGYP